MIRVIIFILVFANICSSCRKPLKGGCRIKTDTINHDPTAEYEDGSCIFISELNIVPDSVNEYPVDIYIDDTFRTRLTRIVIPDVGFIRGYTEKFPSNETHRYRVEDDFGMVWEDTFRTPNQFRGILGIRLRR